MVRAKEGQKPAQNLGRHFRVVSLATGLSRVTGFARDMINAHLFGAGLVSDAYFSANRIPNLLRDLFAEGALSSALVPALSKSLRLEKAKATWALASQVFTFLLLSVGLVVALGILFAKPLVALIAPGFLSDPVKFTLTVHLTQILFPVLLFVSMAAFCMGLLNSHERYGVSALAPIAMNLTLILAGGALVFFSGLGPDRDLANIYWWTLATSAGMLLQWLVQIPAVLKLGGRLRLSFKPTHPGFWEILLLMGPALFSLSVTQIDLVLNQVFASFLPTGSVTCLNYGNRLMQLPYGVFGVSIATVVFPLISRQAAVENHRAIRSTLSRALEAALFITLPATLGLCLLSLPVCRLAFEHGEFTLDSSRLVAGATCMYTLGLFAHTGIKLLTQAFYPIRKARWPFWAALANMLATAGLNLAALLFVPDNHLKFLLFPLATSAGAFLNLAVLVWGLERYGLHLEYGAIAKEGTKILLATALMGLVAWGALKGALRMDYPGDKAVAVFLPAALGAAAYWFLAKRLRCRSLAWVLENKRRGKK
ncbi:MAG TPA: murein biosynthesis integral membrane protein MurJ [bacterium]|nr:murein biosynthesis integral membrane protein MurJ [bacterium]